jgi:hypothetical protein
MQSNGTTCYRDTAQQHNSNAAAALLMLTQHPPCQTYSIPAHMRLSLGRLHPHRCSCLLAMTAATPADHHYPAVLPLGTCSQNQCTAPLLLHCYFFLLLLARTATAGTYSSRVQHSSAAACSGPSLLPHELLQKEQTVAAHSWPACSCR